MKDNEGKFYCEYCGKLKSICFQVTVWKSVNGKKHLVRVSCFPCFFNWQILVKSNMDKKIEYRQDVI